MDPEIEINDSVHGLIQVPRYAVPVIETALVQRLRFVQQCGSMSMVFPTATHSRFAHSIGTMHLARLYAGLLGRNDATDPDARAFVLASLLHDVGHGPLSHVFERAMAGTAIRQTFGDHDTWRKQLLWKNAELLDAVGGVDMARRIVRIWDGALHAGLDWHTLLSGPAGVDRLDYLMRDTAESNPVCSLRMVAVHMILHNTSVDPETGRIVYNDKARAAITELLRVRWYMHRNIYTHKTVHAADTLVTRALRDPAMLETVATLMHPDRFDMLTDAVVLAHPAMADYRRRRLPKMTREVRSPAPIMEFEADPRCWRVELRFDDAETSDREFIYRWFSDDQI